VGHPLLTGARRRRKHAHPRGGAGCFCSELTAIDNSSSAEILVRLWFGDLKNSEMTSFPGCSSLFCGAKQPQQNVMAGRSVSPV
jgi:hypothetical protein